MCFSVLLAFEKPMVASLGYDRATPFPRQINRFVSLSSCL